MTFLINDENENSSVKRGGNQGKTPGRMAEKTQEIPWVKRREVQARLSFDLNVI